MNNNSRINRRLHLLVRVHFQQVYRYLACLAGDEATALKLAKDTFAETISWPGIRQAEMPGRLELFSTATRLFYSRFPFHPASLQAGLTYLKSVEFLSPEDIEEIVNPYPHVYGQDSPASELKPVHNDSQPRQFLLADPAAMDPGLLDTVFREIRDRLLPGGPIDRRPARLETVWTILLAAALLFIIYLSEARPDQAQNPNEPIDPFSQPAAQEIRFAPNSPETGSERGLLRLVDPLPFHTSGAGFTADGEVYAFGHGEGWIYFCYLDRRLQTVPAADINPSLEDIAFSRTGERLASGTHTGEVLIWQLLDGQPARRVFRLPGHPGGIRSLAYAPDGETLAVGIDRGVWLWEIGETARRISILSGRDIDRIAFSQNGRWLATLEAGPEIRLRSLSGETAAHRFSSPHRRLTAILFAPDDRLVLAETSDQGAQIWLSDVPADQIEGDLSFSPLVFLSLPRVFDGISELTISPDGSRVLIGTGSGELLIWEEGSRQMAAAPGGAYFEKLSVDSFDRGEADRVAPGCRQAGWKQVLLNQNFMFPETGQPADQPPSAIPLDQASLLGYHRFRNSVISFVYRIAGAHGQTIYLLVHEPAGEAESQAAFGFLDRMVGRSASIERTSIAGTSVSYLEGGWAFSITNNPSFSDYGQQLDRLDWKAEWDSDSGRQTLRWELEGRLYELIHLPRPGGDPTGEPATFGREDLFAIAQTILDEFNGAFAK